MALTILSPSGRVPYLQNLRDPSWTFRVRKEVFRGSENRGAHRRGSELAAVAVLTLAVAAYCLYARWTGFCTGLLLGGCLGVLGDGQWDWHRAVAGWVAMRTGW